METLIANRMSCSTGPPPDELELVIAVLFAAFTAVICMGYNILL